MQLSVLDVVLWILTFVEHLILLCVLLRIHRLPIFTCLIGLNVLRTIVLFLLRTHGPSGSYFYAYWSLAVVDVTLQLGIVYELARSVFSPTGTWALQAKRDLATWVCLSVMVAASLSQVPKPSSEFFLQVIILKLSFFSAALLSELFIGMLVLSARARLSWSDDAAKIASGFAIYSLATLLVETANTFFGLGDSGSIYSSLSRIRIAVYAGCAGYWIASLLPSIRTSRQIPEHIERQASAVSGALASRLDTLRSEDSRE
jgi:hypothetical protein